MSTGSFPKTLKTLCQFIPLLKEQTDLLGTMKSHSFVQLAQGVGANSWWECPDWTLVSILCVSITADEKGEVKTSLSSTHLVF